VPEPTFAERLEELLINAPAAELPGLLEHARIVVRVRSAIPAKRPYVRKNGNPLANATLVPHSDNCACNSCQTARAQV
jgi:hypothetical protein